MGLWDNGGAFLTAPTDDELVKALLEIISAPPVSEAPTISVNASDPDAAETKTGETANPGQFTLTRTGITTQELTVNYTVAGTAANGTDYQNITGTVTFKVGEDRAIVDINPIDDNTYEGNETVILTLADGGTNYKLDPVKSSGTVTIADNETRPTISINNISQTEGNSGTTNYGFNLTLSTPSVETVTVKYTTADDTAIAGSDYTAATGTVTFNPGETSQTVNISVNGDELYEADETFKLNLSDAVNATIANSSATGTITPGETSKTINVSIIDDAIFEDPETFKVKLTNPTNATLATAEARISHKLM